MSRRRVDLFLPAQRSRIIIIIVIPSRFLPPVRKINIQPDRSFLFQVSNTNNMDMLTCQYVKLPEDSPLPNFFSLSSYATGSLKVNRFACHVLPFRRCIGYRCYFEKKPERRRSTPTDGGFTAKSRARVIKPPRPPTQPPLTHARPRIAQQSASNYCGYPPKCFPDIKSVIEHVRDRVTTAP